MRTSLLVLALLLAVSLAGVVPLSAHELLERTPNPNDVLKQVHFSPLDYCDPEVEVEPSEAKKGVHGVAHNKFKALYPHYLPHEIKRCRYQAYGNIRFYTFTVSVSGATKEGKTAVQVNGKPVANATEVTVSNPDADEGFFEVDVEWAQEDPTISTALKTVIKVHWNVIKANPLQACWQKPLEGVFVFRFYFKNVAEKFEYNQTAIEANEPYHNESYFADDQPTYAVGSQPLFDPRGIQEFSQSPLYNKTVEQLNKTLGNFEKEWLLNVSVSSNAKGDQYVKISVNFKPFLVKQDYEAHFYGNAQKAALLKIDETTFNADGKGYENWHEIKKFNSYFAFHEANEYVITQFNWLRFYKVVAAYSVLHKGGRNVRLVYQGLKDFVDPGNQINIVIFIDECGRYFINRNDFYATNLGSFGRNNWVSLFVATPDVTKATYYQSIVKFYKSIYPKFWNSNQLVDIKFKGGLHIVKFYNPTNLFSGYQVLEVAGDHVVVLNKVAWELLEESSPLWGRLENYVRGKNSVSKVMFVQRSKTPNGTIFEVSYLDADNKFNAAYVKYVEANDVFTDDESNRLEAKYFGNETYIDPLPKDIQTSIVEYLKSQDESLTAIVNFVSLSPRSFAVLVITGKNRWQLTLNWVDGKWTISSKQPYNDGFYVAEGFPSSVAASCSGFLARLYPAHFKANFLYVVIEAKNVGVSLFNRIVFDFGEGAFEGVVQVTFGVANSHVLKSWKPVAYLRRDKDYGYGSSHDFDYGVDKELLYEDEEVPAPKSNLSKEEAKPAEVAHEEEDHHEQGCPHGTKPDIFTHQCVVVFGL